MSKQVDKHIDVSIPIFASEVCTYHSTEERRVYRAKIHVNTVTHYATLDEAQENKMSERACLPPIPAATARPS